MDKTKNNWRHGLYFFSQSDIFSVCQYLGLLSRLGWHCVWRIRCLEDEDWLHLCKTQKAKCLHRRFIYYFPISSLYKKYYASALIVTYSKTMVLVVYYGTKWLIIHSMVFTLKYFKEYYSTIVCVINHDCVWMPLLTMVLITIVLFVSVAWRGCM